jgi:hypothetical protein
MRDGTSGGAGAVTVSHAPPVSDRVQRGPPLAIGAAEVEGVTEGGIESPDT